MENSGYLVPSLSQVSSFQQKNLISKPTKVIGRKINSCHSLKINPNQILLEPYSLKLQGKISNEEIVEKSSLSPLRNLSQNNKKLGKSSNTAMGSPLQVTSYNERKKKEPGTKIEKKKRKNNKNFILLESFSPVNNLRADDVSKGKLEIKQKPKKIEVSRRKSIQNLRLLEGKICQTVGIDTKMSRIPEVGQSEIDERSESIKRPIKSKALTDILKYPKIIEKESPKPEKFEKKNKAKKNSVQNCTRDKRSKQVLERTIHLVPDDHKTKDKINALDLLNTCKLNLPKKNKIILSEQKKCHGALTQKSYKKPKEIREKIPAKSSSICNIIEHLKSEKTRKITTKHHMQARRKSNLIQSSGKRTIYKKISDSNTDSSEMIENINEEWINLLESKFTGTNSEFVEEFKAKLQKNQEEMNKKFQYRNSAENSMENYQGLKEERILSSATESNEFSASESLERFTETEIKKSQLKVPPLCLNLIRNEDSEEEISDWQDQYCNEFGNKDLDEYSGDLSNDYSDYASNLRNDWGLNCINHRSDAKLNSSVRESRILFDEISSGSDDLGMQKVSILEYKGEKPVVDKKKKEKKGKKSKSCLKTKSKKKNIKKIVAANQGEEKNLVIEVIDDVNIKFKHPNVIEANKKSSLEEKIAQIKTQILMRNEKNELNEENAELLNKEAQISDIKHKAANKQISHSNKNLTEKLIINSPNYIKPKSPVGKNAGSSKDSAKCTSPQPAKNHISIEDPAYSNLIPKSIISEPQKKIAVSLEIRKVNEAEVKTIKESLGFTNISKSPKPSKQYTSLLSKASEIIQKGTELLNNNIFIEDEIQSSSDNLFKKSTKASLQDIPIVAGTFNAELDQSCQLNQKPGSVPVFPDTFPQSPFRISTVSSLSIPSLSITKEASKASEIPGNQKVKTPRSTIIVEKHPKFSPRLSPKLSPKPSAKIYPANLPDFTFEKQLKSKDAINKSNILTKKSLVALPEAPSNSNIFPLEPSSLIKPTNTQETSLKPAEFSTLISEKLIEKYVESPRRFENGSDLSSLTAELSLMHPKSASPFHILPHTLDPSKPPADSLINPLETSDSESSMISSCLQYSQCEPLENTPKGLESTIGMKIEQLIPLILTSEITEFLNKVPFKNFEKEVDSSTEFILEYLETMAQELCDKETEILEAINTPLYQDPLSRLSSIQDTSKHLSRFPSLELVLPVELCSELKVIFVSLDLPTRQIYLQMLFDCVNEALNYIRPFGISGLPDPWSNFPRILFGEAELQNVFSRIMSYLMKWSGFCIGVYPTFGFSIDEEILISHREEKMSGLLCVDAREEEDGWLKYDDEETQIKILLGDDLFMMMVEECLRIFKEF